MVHPLYKGKIFISLRSCTKLRELRYQKRYNRVQRQFKLKFKYDKILVITIKTFNINQR